MCKKQEFFVLESEKSFHFVLVWSLFISCLANIQSLVKISRDSSVREGQHKKKKLYIYIYC